MVLKLLEGCRDLPLSLSGCVNLMKASDQKKIDLSNFLSTINDLCSPYSIATEQRLDYLFGKGEKVELILYY